jgi:2-polyprenyl-3-methyl-5-hydroxy-6-metoxy-1,4-benzoquinol methylase
MPALSRQTHIDLPSKQDIGVSGAEMSPIAEIDERGCVVCHATTSNVLLEVMDTRFGIPRSYAICRCSVCGLEQTDPRPNPDDLKHLYETYYNFGGEQGTTYTHWRERFFASWLYRLWLVLDGDGSFHTQRGSGRLMDIGCNEGRGLKIYRRNGFLAEGLELNQRAAEVARAAGFTVYGTLMEDFYPTGAYDVVVLSNVLEHALDPKRMLWDVARILKPGGQVWVSCPNSQSWLRKLFGRSWINWHVPFHIVHFSPATLRRLLIETRFTNLKLRQITPALWVASSIITQVFTRNARPTKQLRNPFLVLALMCFVRIVLFPLLYLGNRLGRGDCLVVVASTSVAA